MVVTLYMPGKPPHAIEPDGFTLPNQDTGFSHVTSHVAQALGCTPGLVDVQDSGPDFVAYTVFDCEDDVNEEGTAALMQWSKHPEAYASTEADDLLCGPLLLVTKS